MFLLYLHRIAWYWGLFTCFFIVNCHGSNNTVLTSDSYDLEEHEMIKAYLENPDETKTPHEFIDVLFQVKTSLESKGSPRISLSDLLIETRTYLYSQNLFHEDSFNKLSQILSKKEATLSTTDSFSELNSFEKVKHKKTKHSASDKMCWGLCELLAGSLCFIIPHTATYTLGGMLIGDGLRNISSEAIKQSKENREIQKEEGILPPPPGFPDEIMND